MQMATTLLSPPPLLPPDRPQRSAKTRCSVSPSFSSPFQTRLMVYFRTGNILPFFERAGFFLWLGRKIFLSQFFPFPDLANYVSFFPLFPSLHTSHSWVFFLGEAFDFPPPPSKEGKKRNQKSPPFPSREKGSDLPFFPVNSASHSPPYWRTPKRCRNQTLDFFLPPPFFSPPFPIFCQVVGCRTFYWKGQSRADTWELGFFSFFFLFPLFLPWQDKWICQFKTGPSVFPSRLSNGFDICARSLFSFFPSLHGIYII